MPFPPSHPALDRALAARGYLEPTPVQLAVVEADIATPDGSRSDMLVSAQTGSGKTVAYGLALASSLLSEAERFSPADRPLALIIAPTRELAMQITGELGWLYAQTGARIVACVGGMSVRDEQRQLSAGAHIVIGTPGRLCDHLTRGYLDFSSLVVAVLDEADEMLDLGFREELETLLDATPKTRRTLLFSATIARGIAMLAKNYQRDAVRIDTTSQTEPHGDIDYRAMRISPGDTERAAAPSRCCSRQTSPQPGVARPRLKKSAPRTAKGFLIIQRSAQPHPRTISPSPGRSSSACCRNRSRRP
jgi:ATP-dependent RNA helicase DeaD